MLLGLSIVAGSVFVFLAICGVIAKVADYPMVVIVNIACGFVISLCGLVVAGYLVGSMLGAV